ncbi:MAG: tail fiber domain-containing protein [Bacteroidetes bacterium]|nr:tail fiber domain-containing protein [Bacteroidota bacterium]
MKKQIMCAGLIALSFFARAQNASYNINSNPITGFNNTGFGFQTLLSNTTGNHNAATGNYALMQNTTGSQNSAHGMNALRFNTTGELNTATGSTALYSNTSGVRNTSTGFESMRQNQTGVSNCANGYWALYSNIDGSGNTADGFRALFTNTKGTLNTALGFRADVASASLTNATAIGANASVVGNNNMILGDNNVNVGIGLSGVGIVPANKLELNTTASSPYFGSANGSSGLRFRNMTSTATPMANPGAGVLSVDANGDVIYVPSTPSTSNFGGSCSLPFTSSNLSSDYRVGLNGKAVNFSGTGNVNIGDVNDCMFSGSSSPARLWVRNTFGSPNPIVGFRVDNIGGPGAYAAYFSGDVFSNGVTTSLGGFVSSDKTIKKDIKPIANGLDILNKIQPKTYFLDNSNVPQLNLGDNRLQYGVIAQELETVLPELVKEITVANQIDNNGKEIYTAKQLKSVNYTALIPIIITAVKEQQQIIEKQQKQIDALLAINTAASERNKTLTQTNIELSDKNAIVLDQNVPNPFAENTSITYTIPSTFKTAQIIFTGIDGKIIKTAEIKESGSGKINVFAADLSSGLYTYSLVIDGQVKETKKMIKQD